MNGKDTEISLQVSLAPFQDVRLRSSLENGRKERINKWLISIITSQAVMTGSRGLVGGKSLYRLLTHSSRQN